MDMYGLPAPDYFRIDDLLDFSNEDELTTATAEYNNHSFPPPQSSFPRNIVSTTQSTDFTDVLSIPSDDVAELEWLSNFVHDSFSHYPLPEQLLLQNRNLQSEAASPIGRVRSKRSRLVTTTNNIWASSSSESESTLLPTTTPTRSSETSGDWEEVRRCTHCSSEKTPQWRTGPLGPKTLCNACGVRFKSGRLVPEYRPAASPTFVLTQHSNSHRKVMELRRQKETGHHPHQHQHQQEEQHKQRQQLYHHHHQVC